MTKTIKPFRYVEELDCFVATPEWTALVERLGLAEWSTVVFLGRLFARDNDFGEHTWDNWDEREQLRAEAEAMGIDHEQMLIVVPQRFSDGLDEPHEGATLPINLRKGFNLTEIEAMSTGSDNDAARMLAGDIMVFVRALQPDGPCNPPELRKMFWTAVLKSLELPYEFLFAAALENGKDKDQLREKHPQGGFEAFDFFQLQQEIEKIKTEIASA